MKKGRWLIFGLLFSILIGIGFLKVGGASQPAKEGGAGGGGNFFSRSLSKKGASRAKSDAALHEEKARKLEQKIIRLWEAQLEKYPNLRCERVSIEESEDALWGIYQLGEELGEEEISRLSKILGDFEGANLDLAKTEAFLLEQENLFDSLKSVLSRSESSLERFSNGFVSAQPALTFQDLLLLEARVAMSKGEEERMVEALRWNESLEKAFDGPENTLIVESIRILLDVTNHRTIAENILPQASSESREELAVLLERRDYSPSSLAQVYRSELDFLMRNLSSLAFADSDASNGINNSMIDGFVRDEVLLEAVKTVAQSWNERIELLEEVSISAFFEGKSLSVVTPDFEHEEARSIFEGISLHSSAWERGTGRAAASAEQALAAVEIIEREAGGEVFSGQITTETVNPVTGEPFLFDAETREVRADQAFQRTGLLPPLSLLGEP